MSEKEGQKFIRSPIICILGHVDHGKCVAADTQIMVNGSIKCAKEIFDAYSKKGSEISCTDGTCIELTEHPEFLTFDGKKIVQKSVSHIWRKKADNLVKVTLNNGDFVSTTPEHPFLVFNDFNIEFRRADQLQLTDIILGPSSFSFNESHTWKSKILTKMAELDCFVVFIDPNSAVNFIQKITSHTKTQLQKQKILSTAYKENRYRIKDFVNLVNFFEFDLNEAYDWIIAFKNSSKKWRAGKTSSPMRLPTNENLHDLGYLLGAFAGDGSIEGVRLHNNDQDVQKAYLVAIQNVFGASGKIIFGHTCWEVRTNGSKTLERFFTDVMDVCNSDKSATIRVPWICHNSFDSFRGFIEGWFDTDGYVSPINNCIEFTSKSEQIVRQAAILLSGLGIHASIYQKTKYWNLRISNKIFLEKFLSIFSPHLTRRINTLRNLVHKTSTSRIFDKFSLSDDFKKNISKSLPGKINRTLPYFNQSIKSETLSGSFLKQILKQVTKPNETSKMVEDYFQKELVGIGIRQIETIENKDGWVYDFTIPEHHNFVAERVIIHNTTLLDSIRGTSVAKKEAGGITQMIGASYVRREDIDSLSKSLAEKMKFNLKIPGLLFIDTPGHEAFSNLRDRGGSIADLVLLLVDITKGFEAQTIESMQILKTHKTPFLIVANKIDALNGWKTQKSTSFMESLSKQSEQTQNLVDEKLYTLMGKISEYGFDSERFDRIKDFTKQIGIIPISAKTKEGLSELLVMIAGLSQRFLEGSLEIDQNGRGKGSIIELKEEKGLGTTLDLIVYDGRLNKNDEIAFLTSNGVQSTKIRGLLIPGSGKERFQNVDSVTAAAGVKIYANNLEDAIPGSPIEVVEDFEREKKAIEQQFKHILFQNSNEAGVIVRAESLGSVEALLRLLKNEKIPVKEAAVGPITKKEVLSAAAVASENPFFGAILGFNVRVLDEALVEAENNRIQILTSDIIYRLIDYYKDWVKLEKEKMKKESIEKLTWPAQIKIMEGYIFRASKPAVFGVTVLGGRIKNNYRLMNKNGEIVGEIREIQKDKDKVTEAKSGDELAISCDGIHIGKNVQAGEVLYSFMTSDEIKKWDNQLSMLTQEEKEVFAIIRKTLIISF